MSVATLTFYSEDDPLGSAIGTLTDAEVEVFEVREALWEMPAAHFRLPRNHSAITSGLIADNNYVTVTYPFISANPVFGFWLKDVEAAILSANEQGGEYVQFGGPGVLGVLEHMRLWHSSAVDDQPTRGSADVPGKWWWTDEPYGAILTRVIEEGQEADYGAPLADVTIDFDRVNDSASAAWPNIDAEFEVDIGTDGLSVMEQLREAGDLYIIGHPDLLIQAFNSYGTDRTGSFGAGNVRFEKGVNILTELTREGHMRGQGTHLLLRDKDGNYSTEVISGFAGRAHHLYFEADQTNDDTLLNKIGQEVLNASQTEPEKVELEYTVGNDEANGRYLPWLHFNVGDQVTVHTGSGILDYNEQTFTIVAFRVELDEASDDTSTTTQYRSIRCVVELNHRTRSDARTKPSLPSTLVPVPPVPTTPGTPGESLAEWSFTTLTDDDGLGYTWTNGGLGDGLGAGFGYNGNLATGAFQLLEGDYVPVTAGTSYVIGARIGNYGPGTGTIRLEVIWLNSDPNTLSSSVVGSTTVVGFEAVESTLTAPVGATQAALRVTRSGGPHNNLQIDDAYIRTVGTAATPGQGHPQLVNSSGNGTYTPIGSDQTVVFDRAPTPTDDETEGFRPGPDFETIWIQVDDEDSPTQITNVFVLVDGTEDAAVWLPWPGTTEHDHDDLATSDHTHEPGEGLVGDFISGALSNPPTQAEVESVIGPASARGSVYGLHDSGTQKRYLALSDGVRWHIVPLVNPIEQEGIVALTSSADGGWSGGQPAAAYYNGRTYFGYIDGSSGNIEARTYTHATGTVSSATVLRTVSEDIHANPTVLIRSSDHRVMFWYSEHAGSELYQWVSDDPEDISAGTETTLDSELGGTVYGYKSVVEIEDGIMLVVRPVATGTGQNWSYSISDDEGATWPALTSFFVVSGRTAYPTIAKTGTNRVDVVASDGNSLESDTSILHFYYLDGEWFDTEGTELTLPVNASTATTVWDGATEDNAYGRDDVSLGADGHPRVLFTVDLGGGSYAYRHGRWTGLAWETVQVATITDPLGGARFDSLNPNIVYAARDGHLYRYTTLDEETWTGEQLTSVAATDLFYPVSPTDHAPDLPVIWLAGTFTSHTDFALGINGFGDTPADASADHAQRVVILDDDAVGEAIIRRDSSGTWQISRNDGGDWEDLGAGAGHYEVVMADGITNPPDPVTTDDGTDWVYGWVE